MSARDDLLAVFTAIGSAHAGVPLTPDQLLERLRDPDFRARFNGPPPAEVTFPDERTAALRDGVRERGEASMIAPIVWTECVPIPDARAIRAWFRFATWLRREFPSTVRTAHIDRVNPFSRRAWFVVWS